VTEEVGRLLGAECAAMVRYPDADTGRIVAAWGPVPIQQDQDFTLEHDGVSARVRKTERAARIDDYASFVQGRSPLVEDVGVRSAVGAPIVVAGAVWGALIVGALAPSTWASDAESRIGEFTELAATAVSNIQAQAELAASRARIITAADQARRRFERDLHDGVQQRLVSLGLGVRNAKMMIPPELQEAREQLALVGKELDSSVSDVRDLARGIHPAILSNGGLAPALTALAKRSLVPVRLDVDVSRRLDEPTEVAAYYVVSEALTNTAKHAQASAAEIHVQAREGVLDVKIRDDGVGRADPAGGSGLTGLRDRVEALGGKLAIASADGAGTSLHAQLPIRSGAGKR
jgi:signal transduction histidine kinase